ncbi:hypothetical protein MGYG_00639 [Nannizzia gypsea CBS 118893]|uniref:HNH domain-containing protein n=1 Tax=Arthroderma gypseum (strain ATCC MYA-4604 / CBS 118893) TaxID=535722 RepID=E5R0U4_ARTGP|nr:hypothetical protein MGYG_00639 [Nannizzia gypsea CBS 118893]EFQ97600.1 hypothetical protein MGYG_00639 [Nannizzia gypsea CBS 118893]
MTGLIKNEAKENYGIFRECVSKSILNRSIEKSGAARRRRNRKRNARASFSRVSFPDDNDPAELAEFIDFVAQEMFRSFPENVQTLSYNAIQSSPALADTYAGGISGNTIDFLASLVDPSISESLVTYGLMSEASDLTTMLCSIFMEFSSTVTAKPPPFSATRTTACEICERDWIPLTYHHLIPKAVHSKALKRGWHEECDLNQVAWLCRACHSYVHRMASNEELAREWYTVEAILGREDTQEWAKWAGRLRWKSR